MKIKIYQILALTGLLTLESYAHGGNPCPPDMEPFHEYSLFFGRSEEMSGTLVVTDAAWKKFVAEEITPRFPKGLTVIDARGQFKNDSGTIIEEHTKIVILLVPMIPSDTTSMDLIDEIMQAYRDKFQRKFFLRTHDFFCVQIES